MTAPAVTTPGGSRDGPRRERFCLVSFHAHPDDEALWTGGTLARAAAEGHRVVVVVATAGGAGLTRSGVADLGQRRLVELQAAADELGVARVVCLGYDDSGLHGESTAPNRFAAAPVAAVADRLAALLAEEQADVLTGYDAAGGYGHPDHRQVHRVARLAAERSGVVLLEATVDRRRALWAARLAQVLPGLPAALRPAALRAAFAPPEDLTHRVAVRPFLDRKRAAFAAHASQQSGGDGTRALALYLRLPGAVFAALFGREWFVEVDRPPARRLADDIFATVRERAA